MPGEEQIRQFRDLDKKTLKSSDSQEKNYNVSQSFAMVC